MKARLRSLDSKHQNGQVLVLFFVPYGERKRNESEQCGTIRNKSD